MPGTGQRLAVVVLAIAIAIFSMYFLSRGLGALGAIGFVLLLFVVGVGTRSSTKGNSLDAKTAVVAAPKPATSPPDGHIRFTIVVEGIESSRLAELWTD